MLKTNFNDLIWEQCKDKKTKLGNPFFDCIENGLNGKSCKIGMFACDEYAYEEFNKFFDPAVL